jgi:hypothetical protein
LFNHLSESIDIFNIDYNDFKRKIVFIVKWFVMIISETTIIGVNIVVTCRWILILLM